MNKNDWNITDIFKTKDEMNKAKEQLKEKITIIKKYEGKLAEDANSIAECYILYEEILEIFEKIYSYDMLTYHQNMADTKGISLYKEAENIATELSIATSFIEPELSQIPKEKLEKYIIENDKLKKYERVLKEIIENKKHLLTPEMEKVLSSFGDVFSVSENAYDIFTNTEFKFPKIEDEEGKQIQITHANYTKYVSNNNQTVRKNAFYSMYSLYKKHINTITELYLARVKEMNVKSKMRNYKSALYAAVHNDDSTIEVYNNLVKVVDNSLSLNHRYMALKKKLLNVKEFHMYDVYTNPLKPTKKDVSYEEAKNIVMNALEPMGEEYRNMLKKAFNENWVDVYEKENKRSGAYSLGVYGVHPFVLTNFTNQEEDISTLAHELGHAMHSYYSNANQNIIDSNYTIMVAEVASTVNEMILGNYLIKNESDKTRKAALINGELDKIRATLIRQTMFAEFEKIIHEKVGNNETLTSQDLCEIYLDLNKKYFGPDVIIDEEIKYEWARIPHFYSCFYVYKYATGISSAISIAKKILNKEDGYVEKYISMLKQGCTKKSVELLRNVEVDLETTKPYEDAFEFFKNYLDELDKLI